MSSESSGSISTPAPRFGIGTTVRHLQFGTGRVVAYEPGQYVIVFRGGDTRRVSLSFDGLEAEEKKGDPETDRIRQAMREVLGDRGWIDVDLELSPRWVGGTLLLLPGKADVQAKDAPIEAFFKKTAFAIASASSSRRSTRIPSWRRRRSSSCRATSRDATGA